LDSPLYPYPAGAHRTRQCSTGEFRGNKPSSATSCGVCPSCVVFGQFPDVLDTFGMASSKTTATLVLISTVLLPLCFMTNLARLALFAKFGTFWHGVHGHCHRDLILWGCHFSSCHTNLYLWRHGPFVAELADTNLGAFRRRISKRQSSTGSREATPWNDFTIQSHRRPGISIAVLPPRFADGTS